MPPFSLQCFMNMCVLFCVQDTTGRLTINNQFSNPCLNMMFCYNVRFKFKISISKQKIEKLLLRLRPKLKLSKTCLEDPFRFALRAKVSVVFQKPL